MSELEPQVLLVFERSKRRVNIFVESAKGQFRIHTSCAELDTLPEVQTALCGETLFAKEGEELTRLVPRANIHQVLQQVAQSLAKLS